jgi:hypothetical protein
MISFRSAFVCAVKLDLGENPTGNIVFYIVGTRIHSKTLDEHQIHLDKILKAYARMKVKAERRNRRRRTGKTRWKSQLKEHVLVKSQPVSDESLGVTVKFQRPYEGPYLIKKLINPVIYELCDAESRIRGTFNLKHLKPYLSTEEEKEVSGK